MRFLDEIDVGDPCIVTDPRNGSKHNGRVVAKHPRQAIMDTVDVLLDDGKNMARVDIQYVQVDVDVEEE